MRTLKTAALMLLAFGALNALASEATYMANEGVLIRDGNTAIVFDPLFEDDYGRYQLLPAAMRDKLFAGEPPFDGIDAVFISHAHGDHFSSTLMLEYLRAQPEVKLYAPAQAVAALRADATAADVDSFARVTGIALDNGDDATSFDMGTLAISVFRVPHSGWPTRRIDIENLVFKVTLNDNTTVAHFGDADANPNHFLSNKAVWANRQTDLAMPPYWFFLSDGGRQILNDMIQPAQAVGTHVPTAVPSDPGARGPEYSGVELFTKPGETLTIP